MLQVLHSASPAAPHNASTAAGETRSFGDVRGHESARAGPFPEHLALRAKPSRAHRPSGEPSPTSVQPPAQQRCLLPGLRADLREPHRRFDGFPALVSASDSSTCKTVVVHFPAVPPLLLFEAALPMTLPARPDRGPRRASTTTAAASGTRSEAAPREEVPRCRRAALGKSRHDHLEQDACDYRLNARDHTTEQGEQRDPCRSGRPS